MRSTHSNRQREALMALKDGPMPARVFIEAHNGPEISELSPGLIEFGQRATRNGIEGIALLTQKGHTVLADHARNNAAAARMAGQMIDQLSDKSASDEDREARKRRLLHGPMEFLFVRHDVIGSKG